MGIPLGIDAILLFAFSFPVVMKYRILPVTGTPYWLFGILFGPLIFNILISFFAKDIPRTFHVVRMKQILLWVTLAIVVGGVTVTAIADRHSIAPVWGVHDIVLQQEAAMRYLIHGKNPYKETYFGTPLESFAYDEQGKAAVNPALYHFVMPPWYLLFPFLFYTPANKLFGYFDGRVMLLFCLAATLFLLTKLFCNRQLSNIAIVFTALSPGVIDYFIEGRSDIFPLFWLVLSLFLLTKKYLLLSAVTFGLALMSKQTIWFALPFYAAFLWVEAKKSVSPMVKSLLAMSVTVVLIAGPFLVWDYRAFFDSVIFYLSGNTAHAYPVSGYGFGMFLYEFGVIKTVHDNYPFLIWQILLGIPVLFILLKAYIQKPTLSRFFLGYAASLFVFWYFSRYLNNSHLGYLSSLFTLGIVKSWDEQQAT